LLLCANGDLDFWLQDDPRAYGHAMYQFFVRGDILDSPVFVQNRYDAGRHESEQLWRRWSAYSVCVPTATSVRSAPASIKLATDVRSSVNSATLSPLAAMSDSRFAAATTAAV